MAAIKFKPLEWGTYRALGEREKLLAFDPFGNEFARIDTHGQSQAYIEELKSLAEGRYQAKMRDAIHTLRDTRPEDIGAEDVGIPVESIVPAPEPVKRYDAYQIMMTLDDYQLGKPSSGGKWVLYSDLVLTIKRAAAIASRMCESIGGDFDTLGGNIRSAIMMLGVDAADPTVNDPAVRKVPTGQTPLDDRLHHRYLDVIREGEQARVSGTPSPYHGQSLEHCLHATGWVSKDLRLALDRCKGINHVAHQAAADDSTTISIPAASVPIDLLVDSYAMPFYGKVIGISDQGIRQHLKKFADEVLTPKA